MIPSYGLSLLENLELLHEIHTSTVQTLGLVGEDYSNVKGNTNTFQKA
jgi:malate dehydrogenase (quinone)